MAVAIGLMELFAARSAIPLMAVPFAVGAIPLAVFAFVWHLAVRQFNWPTRWW